MDEGLGTRRLDVLMAPNLRIASADVQERFAQLYRAHRVYVWQRARHLGVRAEDTEDVVQEVFVTAYGLLPSMTSDFPPRPWLFRILVNAVHRHWRKKRQTREDAVDLESVEESTASLREGSGGPGPAEAALLLEKLLANLSKEQRAVVVLAEFEHQTADEIGRTLGINASTAASRLRLARKKLAESAARIEAFRTWRKP